MLREYFPSTDQGARIYGGFMEDRNTFCRLFTMKDSFEKTVNEINLFLQDNGYDIVTSEEFDQNYYYEKSVVSISPHGYQEQFVVRINRDFLCHPQSTFIIQQLKIFRDNREWEQFHNAKDLSIALSIEANELLEEFLWKKSEDAKIDKLKEELADVFSFAFLLIDKLGLDVETIILEKIELNNAKYPIEKSKGTSKKYNDL